MEPEARHPVARTLAATAAAVIGAVQVVLILAWLVENPEPSGQMFLAVPWLVVWWLIALVAARVARRHPQSVDRRD